MMVYFTLNENLSDLIFILASAENLRVRKIHALAIVFLQTLFLLFHKQSEKYFFSFRNIVLSFQLGSNDIKLSLINNFLNDRFDPHILLNPNILF